MKAIKLLMVVIAVSLWGCSDNCDLQLVEESESNDNSSFVSEQEALDNAEKFFEQIGKNVRGDKRTVESIKVLGVNPTRSESGFEGLLYLINYSDNEGFALMGTDKRMYDIYAISDHGHFSYEERSLLPALDNFLNNALKHAYNSIKENSETRGFSWGNGNGSKIIVDHQVSPLVPNISSKWGQLYPFNKYCFTVGGIQSYPGCLPVAVGIYMSYFQWPTGYGSDSFDWNSLAFQDNKDGVAKFLKCLGQETLLQCEYLPGGANSHSVRISPTFENLNYLIDYNSFMKSVKDNFEKLMGILRFGTNVYPYSSPILITASNEIYGKAGHAFVIDGEVSRTFNEYQNGLITNSIKLQPLIHILWGWEGRYNGYFAYSTTMGLIDNKVIEGDDVDYDGESLPEGHIYKDYVFYGAMYPKWNN